MNKIGLPRLSISVIIFVSTLLPASAWSNSTTETRIEQGLDYLLTHPYPYPDNNFKAKYAHLLMVKNQNIDLANKLIQEWCAVYPVFTSTTVHPYTDLRPDNNLFSLYLKPQYHSLLTQTSRDAIEDVCWRWVYRHSIMAPGQSWPLNNPTKTVWYISGSENHDAAQRSANLLSLQILRMAGEPYGPDAVLHDGYTVEQHYQEWVTWYQEFFRQRMREGLTCEIAHPSSYGLATISHYYDIAKLTEVTELKRSAEAFLNLFWANVACEFEPRTGIRASVASTRNYKWSWNQTGDIYWARSLLYAYGWCDIKSNPNLTHLSFYTSSYRPPEIVRAIASDHNRGSYRGTSRRFGRGGGWDYGVYKVIFDNGLAYNSYIIRDSWYTQAYTLSTISLDPGRDYIQLIDQSRIVGVSFSNDINDRVIVYAGNSPVNKDVEYKMTTSNGVTGVLGENCMIVARDPNAVLSTTNSTRIFISDGDLWNNRSYDSEGWVFTKAGDGYCGFMITGDGYKMGLSPYNNGYYVEFNDIWAPVVIQMGEAKNYNNDFEQFKNAVKANTLTYNEGKLTYSSISGDTYEYWSQSQTLPKINGSVITLNPDKTYNFPYLSMVHGEDTATIMYPGYPDFKVPSALVFPFEFTNPSQSTVAAGGYPNRALDGITNGNWDEGYVTLTESSTNPWWHYDLGEIQSLDSIVIFNRTDSLSDRLNNFKLFLSVSPFISTDPLYTENEPQVWSFSGPEMAGKEKIQIPVNLSARYILIQLPGDDRTLSIAEVQIHQRKTTGIQSEIDGNRKRTIDQGIHLFPNPAINELKVESGELKIEEIVIADLQGRIALSRSLSGAEEGLVTLDVSCLKPGVYMIKITQDDRNETVIRRFIKR